MTAATAPGAQSADRFSLQAKERLVTFFVWLALAAGALVIAFPLYWMVATTVMTREDAYSRKFNLLPPHVVLDNYVNGWNNSPWPRWYGNTLIIVVTSRGWFDALWLDVRLRLCQVPVSRAQSVIPADSEHADDPAAGAAAAALPAGGADGLGEYPLERHRSAHGGYLRLVLRPAIYAGDTG